jgi:hypothetical protein
MASSAEPEYRPWHGNRISTSFPEALALAELGGRRTAHNPEVAGFKGPPLLPSSEAGSEQGTYLLHIGC